MKTSKTRLFAILTLAAAALIGCDRGDSRPVPEAKAAIAKPPAAVVPDPPAAPAPAPQAPSAVTSPIAVNVAPSAFGKGEGPQPAPKASKPVAHEDARLKVKRLVIAQGVSNREPVDADTTFSAAEADKIYAFVEIENADRLDSEVTVAFVPPDGKPAIGNVTLDVGASARWRTWAYTRGARQAGTWTAVVRSMSGKVLAKAPFEITK